jgi:hypothetical protein
MLFLTEHERAATPVRPQECKNKARQGPRTNDDIDEPRKWLRSTWALETEHHSIRILVEKLTQLKSTQTEKALACFQYVRTMPFRTCSDPTAMTASKVFRRGVGDSQTKSLLFVSMMRVLGIPARTRIVTLGPGLLHGILNTGGRGITHAMSEVYLSNRWIKVDAYCVDLRLGLAARARLLQEGKKLGYCVHIAGQVAWDGEQNAFGQFSLEDPSSLPIDDLGVYDDPTQLYAQGFAPQAGWADQARWRVSAALVNRRISNLRCSRSRATAGAAT